MAGLQDIRRRIRSVKNTQQVTKAMKMISAVKLRKSQERLVALRPYAGKMMEVVQRVVGRIKGDSEIQPGPTAQAFLNPREEKRIRVVLVASDKGLCGGFNANVLKAANAFVSECAAEIVHLDVVGKRAVEWARKRKMTAAGEYLNIPLTGFQHVVTEIAAGAAAQYQAGEIDALYVIYNYFNSPVAQTPTVFRVFPMALDRREDSREVPEVSHLLEPDPNSVLETLLPRFVETELLRNLLESSASEHGARMAAMDKASNNAGEMIAKLTLTMNKIRQASITNQIIEIVSGANA
ncbi:ATP synthase subunit gamma [Geothrix limicola]|uniref:ATP synthase gamma chain n=1 Tax=Geothrix limicola TaxID=2927978 RepID=A0ABQ5QE24_9BACT|nr:ATP synthase F1 subunit gamma [Geothrix limicola]GLH72912.1 ATP synthase subunit gamma [Geothrix limicola]